MNNYLDRMNSGKSKLNNKKDMDKEMKEIDRQEKSQNLREDQKPKWRNFFNKSRTQDGFINRQMPMYWQEDS